MAVLLLLLLSSCVKDQLKSYNPNAFNDLVIEKNFEDSYLVNVDDVLKFEARVTQGKELNPPNLKYQWSYYSAASLATDTPVVVATTAKLDLEMKMATGEYFLALEATDTLTGVKAFEKIKLTVKRLTSEGWLMLTWKENQANLSIVSSANEVYKNFLKPSADYPITSRPEQLFCVADWEAGVQPIIIKTGKPDLLFLDHDKFEIAYSAKELFSSPPGAELTHFATDKYFQTYYLWDEDGLLYQTSRGASSDPNFPKGFTLPLGGNYKASNILMPTVSFFPVPIVVYDELGQRFQYQPYGENKLVNFPPTPVNAKFDLNHFTDKIVFNDADAGEMTYFVAKNSEGTYFVHTLGLEGIPDIDPTLFRDTLHLLGGPNPDMFALSGKMPLLYFIAGNTLYLHKITENKTIKLYDFPANEKPAALKMFRESITQTEAQNPAVNNRLAIAVNDAAGGIFYTFNLMATGELKNGKYATRNDGFDFIVDIAYKELK